MSEVPTVTETPPKTKSPPKKRHEAIRFFFGQPLESFENLLIQPSRHFDFLQMVRPVSWTLGLQVPDVLRLAEKPESRVVPSASSHLRMERLTTDWSFRQLALFTA